MVNGKIYEQVKPCPKCKKTAGWWSGLMRHSMVLHLPNGETEEERLFEQSRKNCLNCDTDITDCVEGKS